MSWADETSLSRLSNPPEAFSCNGCWTALMFGPAESPFAIVNCLTFGWSFSPWETGSPGTLLVLSTELKSFATSSPRSDKLERGWDGSFMASLRNDAKSAWKLSYSVCSFDLFCSVAVVTDEADVSGEEKSSWLERNELIKSAWSSGFGFGEFEVLLDPVVVFELRENWGVKDDTGLGEEVIWAVDWLSDVWLGDAGGGTPTAAHVISDPVWLLPFDAGVAD